MTWKVALVSAVLGLSACGSQGSNNGTGGTVPPANGGGGSKVPVPNSTPAPKPPVARTPGQIKPLVVQSEAGSPDFANSMTVEIGTQAVGRMAFEYAAERDGSLLLDTGNLLVHGENCSSDPSRGHHFSLSWSRLNADGSLSKIGGFTSAINRFEFRRGNKYRLIYEILDLNAVYADCAGVTIRFAVQDSASERR